jgi:polysaccharide export outer membrane protein
MNFQIMVLGEVRRKGILKFQTPNVDIYQAIAMAGDISIYGKRSNVMIIRQTDSSRIVRRVDLSDPNIIRSDLYQLQSGDLIFVEANSAKRSQNSLAWQFIPIITSGMSFVVAIYGIFRSF